MASEIDEIYSKIMNVLSRGPSLTVDIAAYIGKDTTQTSVIIDYYLSKGGVGRTERRYGTSAIYYLKKDRDAALNMLYQTLNNNEKSLVTKVKNAKVIGADDLTPQERYFSRALTDFIKVVAAQDSDTGEKKEYIYYYQFSLDEVSKMLNSGAAAPVEKNPPDKTSKSGEDKQNKKARKVKITEDLTAEIKDMLFGYGFSNVSKLESEIYYCDYGQNRLRVIVIVSKKNSLTKKDFIKFSGYATSYKTVAFVLSTAKKLADYSSYGNALNIIKMT